MEEPPRRSEGRPPGRINRCLRSWGAGGLRQRSLLVNKRPGRENVTGQMQVSVTNLRERGFACSSCFVAGLLPLQGHQRLVGTKASFTREELVCYPDTCSPSPSTPPRGTHLGTGNETRDKNIIPCNLTKYSNYWWYKCKTKTGRTHASLPRNSNNVCMYE